jgi:membrane fusion protein, peptide pheromone/bacteriocin exporter
MMIWLELQAIHNQQLESQTKLTLLEQQVQNYTIYAPCSGVLSQPSGIKVGSYIMAGQQLTSISIQDTLIAEVYIPAQKIGYIQKNMNAKIFIDAFNFHEWGYINGTVKDILSEIKVVQKMPVLIAQVSLEGKVLYLKNGYMGKLRKGMTISTHFKLKKRSLLALLYDKAENWLDPSKL